jgi:hypothetical protein
MAHLSEADDPATPDLRIDPFSGAVCAVWRSTKSKKPPTGIHRREASGARPPAFIAANPLGRSFKPSAT